MGLWGYDDQEVVWSADIDVEPFWRAAGRVVRLWTETDFLELKLHESGGILARSLSFLRSAKDDRMLKSEHQLTETQIERLRPLLRLTEKVLISTRWAKRGSSDDLKSVLIVGSRREPTAVEEVNPPLHRDHHQVSQHYFEEGQFEEGQFEEPQFEHPRAAADFSRAMAIYKLWSRALPVKEWRRQLLQRAPRGRWHLGGGKIAIVRIPLGQKAYPARTRRR